MLDEFCTGLPFSIGPGAPGIHIEDDYDSEFRFRDQPVPALQGLDRNCSVILLGSFNKAVFPALRMGYVVLPESLIDRFLSFRSGMDLYPSGLNRAILCDFIVEGHLRRHIQRMRELYAERLAALGMEHRNTLGDLPLSNPCRPEHRRFPARRNDFTTSGVGCNRCRDLGSGHQSFCPATVGCPWIAAWIRGF